MFVLLHVKSDYSLNRVLYDRKYLIPLIHFENDRER